jgi:hypothetical protein
MARHEALGPDAPRLHVSSSDGADLHKIPAQPGNTAKVARELCNISYKVDLPDSRETLKRTTRLELATFGLGSRRSTN